MKKAWPWLLAGLLIGAAMGQKAWPFLIIPGVLLLGFAIWRAKVSADSSPEEMDSSVGVTQHRTTRMVPLLRRETGDEEETASAWAAKEDRRRAWDKLEENLDAALLDGLSLAKASMDGVYTMALFFPRRDDTWYLRVWISDSRKVVPGASLQSHQGLVGKLMKDDIKRVLEGDIVTDSSLLQYYSADEGVHSLAGVPILVDGVRRGAVIVDSLREKAFDGNVITRLEALAHVMGMLAWQSYQAFDLVSQRHQLHALAQYQRKFLERMSEDHIVGHALRYLQESVEADRYMVVSRDRHHPSQGQVLGCLGLDQKAWEGLKFSLADRGLLQIVFEKEQVVNRQFQSAEYISRLSHKEKPNLTLQSLLAVPVPTDSGVDMVLCVEAVKTHRFSEHHQNLLTSIARAAGFALSRARLYEEKEHLASRDGLTGVINHRTFQETFQNEILRAQRYGHVLAVLLLDIDFFKKVNDTYGHPIGDRVLVEVAAVLQQQVRAGIDVVARYGGEEFVCLLIDVSRTQAAESAERIRRGIEEKVFDVGAQSLKVTLSIGVALFPEDGRHGKDVLERSDKALYRAKESGRNRVVFYS